MDQLVVDPNRCSETAKGILNNALSCLVGQILLCLLSELACERCGGWELACSVNMDPCTRAMTTLLKLECEVLHRRDWISRPTLRYDLQLGPATDAANTLPSCPHWAASRLPVLPRRTLIRWGAQSGRPAGHESPAALLQAPDKPGP